MTEHSSVALNFCFNDAALKLRKFRLKGFIKKKVLVIMNSPETIILDYDSIARGG